jgi:nicotinamide mononucleotide transporter
MGSQEFLEQISSTLQTLAIWEILGLIFGLLAVIFLIKENIWTWPMGIAYVLVSFIVFYEAKLYADLILHVFFLILNIYGWVAWTRGTSQSSDDLVIRKTSPSLSIILVTLTVAGIFLSGYLMSRYTDASLPYWDSATSMLSITGMWLTARKKIENWYYWLAVDILATGIYFYKGMYFYALLYFIYIGLAVAGYLEWRKLMKLQVT